VKSRTWGRRGAERIGIGRRAAAGRRRWWPVVAGERERVAPASHRPGRDGVAARQDPGGSGTCVGADEPTLHTQMVCLARLGARLAFGDPEVPKERLFVAKALGPSESDDILSARSSSE